MDSERLTKEVKEALVLPIFKEVQEADFPANVESRISHPDYAKSASLFELQLVTECLRHHILTSTRPHLDDTMQRLRKLRENLLNNLSKSFSCDERSFNEALRSLGNEIEPVVRFFQGSLSDDDPFWPKDAFSYVLTEAVPALRRNTHADAIEVYLQVVKVQLYMRNLGPRKNNLQIMLFLAMKYICHYLEEQSQVIRVKFKPPMKKSVLLPKPASESSSSSSVNVQGTHHIASRLWCCDCDF